MRSNPIGYIVIQITTIMNDRKVRVQKENSVKMHFQENRYAQISRLSLGCLVSTCSLDIYHDHEFWAIIKFDVTLSIKIILFHGKLEISKKNA